MAAEPWIDFGDTAYWDDLIGKDFSMVKTLINVKKYFNCGMTCYKAAVKILSRWFVNKHPPHELPTIENLVEFAGAIGICDSLSEQKIELLSDLDVFNEASKSQEQKIEFSAVLTKDYCRDILDETVDLYNMVKAKAN